MQEIMKLIGKIIMNKIVIIALLAISYQSYASEDQRINPLIEDERIKVHQLSRTILKSRLIHAKRTQQDVELYRDQLKDYQHELLGLESIKQNSNVNGILAEDQGWLELSNPNANQKIVANAENSKSRARRNRLKRMPKRFTELASEINNKIPAQYKSNTRIKTKGREERKAQRNKRLLSLLNRVQKDLTSTSVDDPRYYDRLQKMAKRFEIKTKAQKSNSPNEITLSQPTNQIQLKYTIEEFEAMK